VAGFIGQVNLFEGQVMVEDGGALLAAEGLGAPIFSTAPTTAGPGGVAWAAVRPERIRLDHRTEGGAAPEAHGAPAGCNRLAGVVGQAIYLGGDVLLEVELASGVAVRVRRAVQDGVLEPGSPVWLSWDADAAVILST
jgi:ABC-type Fe3+/spermidine/putrescine transport system ATPase subunit